MAEARRGLEKLNRMPPDGFRPKRRDDILSEEVDNEVVLLDVDRNQVHQLNVTAGYVWQECDGTNSVSELCKSFAEAFEVDAEIARQDVHSIILQLKDLSLFVEE